MCDECAAGHAALDRYDIPRLPVGGDPAITVTMPLSLEERITWLADEPRTRATPTGARVLRTIPVPAGWSVEQTWEAISRGEKVPGPAEDEPGWVNIETDDRDRLVRVLPSTAQIRERATDLAKAADVADDLDELTERLAEQAVTQAADRGRALSLEQTATALLQKMQTAVGEHLDDVDPVPAA